MILVDRISAGEQLQEAIPDSVFIKGDVKLKDRKEQYDEIKENEENEKMAKKKAARDKIMATKTEEKGKRKNEKITDKCITLN